MSVIIDVKELTKTFKGGIQAVKGVSFSIQEGEIFGFLGPNGAGKSTMIMMLTTLLRPTSGTALINGHDIQHAKNRVRHSFGYVSQDLAVDDRLTGRENLLLQARFYHIPRREAAERIDELLELVNLASRQKDLAETYSGGMKKRLDIACGLIHRPRILFLDEPTLGLDIQTRRQIWEYVMRLRREQKMTIFITTHYMDEADALCDRIAIIDEGLIKAIDTPANLKATLGGDIISLAVHDCSLECRDRAMDAIRSLPHVKQVTIDESSVSIITDAGESVLPRIFTVLHEQGVEITNITLKKPSLDEVFLSHTGKALRDEHVSRDEGMRQRMLSRRRR